MKEYLMLDTHAVIWFTLEQDKLSDNIKSKINSALQNGSVIISSITLWEIAMLTERRRINIFEPVPGFLKSITEIKGLNVHDISPLVAAESVRLPDGFHGDPADRIIVATALCSRATLITKDQKILDWAKRGHIRVFEA